MSTTTAAAPSAGTCGATLYDIPVDDVACAMPHSDSNVELFSKCCKDADVISYSDDCGVYCLALGQSEGDLRTCLFDEGATHGEVFCRSGQDPASSDTEATATGAEPRESADTTVVQEGEDNESSDDEDDEDGEGDDESAAALARPAHTTVGGVVIGALLFTATAFGGIMI